MAPAYRFPLGIERSAPGRIHWQRSDGARFTEPFVDDTVRRLRAAGLRDTETTPADEWDAAIAAPAVDAIVLHVSRCGSTLVTQIVAASPDCLAVSEAPIFDDLLRGRGVHPAMADGTRERRLRHAVTAFVQSQADAPARVVLKLDCWHVFEISCLARAFPDVPIVFVYRDPIEVLVSLMERPSLTLVRDTVTPAEIGVLPAARDALSPEAHAAAILGGFFRHATLHRRRLTPIAYTALPTAVWTALPWAHPDRVGAGRVHDASRADAKAPWAVFEPDSLRKRAVASPALKAACARWATPAYETWLSAI